MMNKWLIMTVVLAATQISSCALKAENGLTINRSFSQVAQDKQITTHVEQALFGLDTRYKYAHIDVQALFNAVLLTGQVPDARLKQMAEARAMAVPNVNKVHNYLTVADNLPLDKILADEQVCTVVKNELQGQSALFKATYDVTCQAEVVYLMGRMTEKQLEVATDTLKKMNAIKKIVFLIDKI